MNFNETRASVRQDPPANKTAQWMAVAKLILIQKIDIFNTNKMDI